MSKSIAGFAICEDKNIEPHELANLFALVGWGDDADYQPDIISRSIAAYPVVAYCRDSNGLLVAILHCWLGASSHHLFDCQTFGEQTPNSSVQRIAFGSR